MWLWFSFGMAILTNMIVLIGFLSLIYWFGEEKTGWVKRYHDPLQIVSCWLFVVYVLGRAAVHGHYANVVESSHWTYFTVLVICTFEFNLLMVSKLHCTVLSVVSLVYCLLYTQGQVLNWSFALTLLCIVIQWGLTVYGAEIWAKRGLMYPLMAVYGGAALLAIGTWATRQSSVFWSREILAMVVQLPVVYEYGRLLITARRTNDRYQQEAAVDRMTGLKNFGRFNQDLQGLYHAHQQTDARFWLFELDIDHFKAINDTYGHLMGNTVLETVARQTRAYADTLDYATTVYRMGGEEFCLLLRGGSDNCNKALTMAEGLRKRLAELVFHTDDGQSFGITVSIGVEYAHQEDKHYLDIYNRVDQALYAAKHSGRNAVVLYQQPDTANTAPVAAK